MIGDRIRQRRIMAGMSLQDVANELSKTGKKLTRAILSRYELGQSTPNALVLRDLASILGVKTDYFFSESTTNITWQAFRKKASISQTKLEKIRLMAEQQVERFISVESTCGISPEPSDVPGLQTLSNPSEAEAIAEKLREGWNLDDFPIKSLSELLENKGIILAPLDTGIDDIDGIVGTLPGKRKIIAYEVDKSVDRTRLTMAHELGHMLVRNDGLKLNEKLASRFAGAFLAPAKSLRRDMGPSRKSFSIPELCLLKEKYGISIQALTYRAKDLGILSESAYKSMFINFRSKGIGAVEPGCWPYSEQPLLMRQYIFRAVAEDRISEAKALELYPRYLKEKTDMETSCQDILMSFSKLNPKEMDRRLMTAAESAADLYENGGVLSGYDTIDDVKDYE